jgi:hypothetical protein
MGTEEIRLDLIHWISETTDIGVLKKIQKIRHLSSGLSPEQETILEQRMEKYEKGEMKFSTWDEVKKRITSKKK